MKYIKSRIKAHRLMADDRIKIGGQMYRLTDVTRRSAVESRLHIQAYPIGGDEVHERISLFMPALQKLTIYNQK